MASKRNSHARPACGTRGAEGVWIDDGLEEAPKVERGVLLNGEW